VLGILLLLYYPFAIITFYNLFARIKNEKGIVPVPAQGRGLFTTFAILGLVVIAAITALLIFASVSASRSHGYRSYDTRHPYQEPMMQNQNNMPMSPSGDMPNMQMQ
jgi:hypothetical protein